MFVQERMCGVCSMCRKWRACLLKIFLNNRFFWNCENIRGGGYYRTNGWSRLVGVFRREQDAFIYQLYWTSKKKYLFPKFWIILWLMLIFSWFIAYTDPLPRHNHISCARTLGLCVARSPKPIFDPWPPIRARREQMQKLGCRAETINIQMVPSSREPGLRAQWRGSVFKFNDLLEVFITIKVYLGRFRKGFLQNEWTGAREVCVHINVLIHYS